MSWVSFPPLVAAVTNAGGLGILGAAFMSPDELQESIRDIKARTNKPFGVNFMPGHPQLEDLLDIIIHEKVAVASYGKGNPKRIIERTMIEDDREFNLQEEESARNSVRPLVLERSRAVQQKRFEAASTLALALTNAYSVLEGSFQQSAAVQSGLVGKAHQNGGLRVRTLSPPLSMC